MKKWFKTAATLLLAAIVLAVCALLSGGIDIGKLSNVEYKAAEYICSEEVSSVKLCDSSQDIEILPSEDGRCRLEYVKSEYDDYEISLTEGLLSVKRSERFHLSFFDFEHERVLRLFLPEGEYDSIYVDSSSGDVTCAVGAGNISVHTSSGDVNCTAAAERISIDTSSGDVSLTGSAAECITLSTSSGDIDAQDVAVSGEFKADTASGEVSFRGLDAGSISISTASGDVEGSVTKPMQYEADTASGDVDIPVSARDAAVCRIETASGDISIFEE